MAKISRKALLIGAAALALGVGAYAYAQKPAPKKKKGNGNGGVIGPVTSIPAAPGNQDKKVMTEQDPDARTGFTSFFTPDTEKIIVSDLQAWQNTNNPGGGCTWVTGYDPGEFGQGEFNDYLAQAREAAADVLQKRYPEGAWRPYNTEAGTPLKPGVPLKPPHPLWQRWLFLRVENIAKREVCSFTPGT